MAEKTIVLFYKDFRLHDQPVLTAAVQRGTVIPVFIWSPEEEMIEHTASDWWLHHALYAFSERLTGVGLPLIIRRGERLPVLQSLIAETGATAIYFNERHEPKERFIDYEWAEQLSSQGVDVKQFSATLLQPSMHFSNAQGEPYKVYTSFLKRFLKEPVPSPFPMMTPVQSQNHMETPYSLSIDDLGLLPTHDWHQKFHADWQPGETAAIEKWRRFLKEPIGHYEEKRDYPAQYGGSGLSPHLAFGEISARAMWFTIEQEKQMTKNVGLHTSLETFQKQLVWRDFAYHQLVYFPEISHRPLRSQFLSFPWRQDDEALQKWKRGQTGYPIVDAGMRQLWQTGWMHNRVRMIVASFLVKHLLIPWQEGERWFAETLVDYDMANNAMGWQWSAGCGIDSAPYFRIFNPILQGQKFDQEGTYVRKWIPELKSLPTLYIHEPWKAPRSVLQLANVDLGKTYPLPIVDHSFARQRALDAYAEIKGKG